MLLCGHALLEKSLAPYKSMTAHALLLQVDTMPLQGEALLRQVDIELAGRLSADAILATPSDLSPLPLAGIPGWWRKTLQDANFYADRRVFRDPPADLRPAPLHAIRGPNSECYTASKSGGA